MQAFLDSFDIYLLEAVVNGILLGRGAGVAGRSGSIDLRVIDVTWICYAELVMIGMYGMYYLVQYYHLPVLGRGAACHSAGRAARGGAALYRHRAAIDGATDNQLLATGGVLFILQSFATVAFGVEFPQSRHSPACRGARRMHFSYARLCPLPPH